MEVHDIISRYLSTIELVHASSTSANPDFFTPLFGKSFSFCYKYLYSSFSRFILTLVFLHPHLVVKILI